MSNTNYFLMKRILTLVAIVLMGTFSTLASAQGGYQVKGVVEDAMGPVIGATVIEQGTSNGTSTGLDGDFILTVSSPDAIVEISCIGYASQTFKASAVPAKVILEEDAEFLDEVVVIGYGTVKKTDMTGSISTVKSDELNKGAISSPADLLRGKSAGVVVTSGNGQPGSGATIRIRGGSSLSATNDPLVVIDGLPVSNEGISGMSDPLSSINPSDIESFTVLKDASATAIYGSRASNGVIVITTKKGAKGATRPQVSMDYQTSLSHVSKLVDVMDAADIRKAISSYLSENQAASALAALGNADTNWQKEIYQLAWSNEYNVSVRGRLGLWEGAYMPWRVSGGILAQEGTLKTGRMNRSTASVNLTPTLFNDHLTINLNGKFVNQGNRYANSGAIGAALRYDPTKPVYDANGIHGYTTWRDADGNYNTMATQNPVAMLYEKQDSANANRFIGNAQFDYKIHGFEDLRLNLNLGLDFAKSSGFSTSPVGSEQSIWDTKQSGSGYYTDYGYMRRDQTLEFYAAYSHDWAKHHFDVMGGYSWQHFWNSSNSLSTKLTDNSVLSDHIGKTEYFLVSFFGRMNYSFGNRYLITATVRRDGTSRFQNHKWGLFPSVALGWNIKNEPFLENSNFISTLKFRASWGQTGQQDLNAGNYPSLATYYGNLIGSYYQFGGQTVHPVTPLGYNSDLKWETTTTYNVGMDFGFVGDRLTFSVDAYKRNTSDLINYIPVAAGSNLTNFLTTNIGDLENLGVEVDLNAVLIERPNTSWTVGINAAYNHNEITKLTASPNDHTGVETGGISGGTGNNVQMHQVGHPTSAFYVFKQVYDQAGKPIDGAYVDLDGNEVIDDNDRYFFHKPAADVNVGLNTTFSWKNWTAALSGHGSFGNWVYNNVASNQEMTADLWTNSFVSNRLMSAFDSEFAQARYRSDYYVRNASYFKFDNFTLSRNFPNIFGWAENLSINVFGTVQNIYTITKYDGLDPEVFGGIDGEIYPRPRTYILGVKVNF